MKQKTRNNTKDIPPPILYKNETTKKTRSSNLELYRIVCMIMIVAHHFVVNSGLTTGDGGPLAIDHTSGNSIFLTIFGAWGKTGINCFLMITGYFMCTSKITMRKFLKLMGQVYFYKLLLFPILLIAGYEIVSPQRLIKLLMPTWGFSDNFLGCFIGFWLTIPFLNILIRNMSKREHEWLLVLMLTIYSFLGSVPSFNVTFNYVTWFGIIYFIASYIRIYPLPIFNRGGLWGWLTLFSTAFAIASILVQRFVFSERPFMGYFFVSDSNKFLAVAIAVCSFLWFKNMNIKYSKVVNAFGAGTFGVLLIHANSEAMRTWLWKDTVDVVGHYMALTTVELVIYSVTIVLAVFVVCNLIDQIRIASLEKWFLNRYDKNVSTKVDNYIDRIFK